MTEPFKPKRGPKPKGTMRGAFRPMRSDVDTLTNAGLDYREIAATAVKNAAEKVRAMVRPD